MLAERGKDGDHAACAAAAGHAQRPGDGDGDGGEGGGVDAGAARARLPDLQRDAAEAYAAITAADDALRVLAGHRVTAERALRLAAARHQAASRAVAAHARARPGPFARPATRAGAVRQWDEQRPALEAALADAERQLAAAQVALSLAKDDFAARLTARAAAAATLRRLTAECAAVLSQVAAAEGGSRPGT
jgi:hypothetical protein